MHLQRTRTREIIYDLAIAIIEELIQNENFETNCWKEKITDTLHLKELTDEQIVDLYDLSEYVLENDIENEYNRSNNLERKFKAIDGIEIFKEIINSEAKIRGFYIWAGSVDSYFNDDEIFEIGGHKFAFARSSYLNNNSLSISILKIGKENRGFYEYESFSKNISTLCIDDSFKEAFCKEKKEVVVDLHAREFVNEFIKKYGTGTTREISDKYTKYLLVELKDISKIRDMKYLY